MNTFNIEQKWKFIEQKISIEVVNKIDNFNLNKIHWSCQFNVQFLYILFKLKLSIWSTTLIKIK